MLHRLVILPQGVVDIHLDRHTLLLIAFDPVNRPVGGGGQQAHKRCGID
jgi:hypothetical protein